MSRSGLSKEHGEGRIAELVLDEDREEILALVPSEAVDPSSCDDGSPVGLADELRGEDEVRQNLNVLNFGAPRGGPTRLTTKSPSTLNRFSGESEH